jgi:hypothetical protein
MNDNNEKKTNLPSLEDDSQTFLLPRSAWQDRRAFATILLKTKRVLDLAEIGALLP